MSNMTTQLRDVSPCDELLRIDLNRSDQLFGSEIEQLPAAYVDTKLKLLVKNLPSTKL